jgi:hypothetical protein
MSRNVVWIGVFFLALIAGARGLGAEPCVEAPQDGFLKRMCPIGGWHPYGGGLVHWWDPHCFPCGGAPDDYCRKPLPRLCWPAYPAWYIWGPPEICYPQCNGRCDCDKQH